MDASGRPGVWRRRLRAGGDWWAERQDGSWVRWSALHAEWEDMPGPPEGVSALPPDTPPLLRSDHVERPAGDEIRVLVTRWIAGFALFTSLTAAGLAIVVASQDLAPARWTELLPYGAALLAISVTACATCIGASVVNVKLREKLRRDAIDGITPPPHPRVMRRVGVPSLLAFAVAAGIVVGLTFGLLSIELPGFF